MMRVRKLLILGLGGAAGALVIWGAGDRIAHGQTFRVSEVSFAGNSEVSSAQLRHLAEIRQGTHMFQADLNRAVHGVQKHPWVESASARRHFPGTVKVTVHEHKPELLVALDRLWYADARGHVFKQADPSRMDFPILTGLQPDVMTDHPQLGRRIISSAFSLLRALEAGGPVDPSQLSELHFDSHRGFTLVLRNSTKVIIGFDDPEPRLDRLAQMVSLGLNLNEPAVIDLDIATVAVVTPQHSPTLPLKNSPK
jgi:cell division septal protein FtsQ